MNDLQIILIIIGALIIAGVLLFNWWQERKFNQQVESSFSKLQNDALLNDEVSVAHTHVDNDNAFEEDNFSIDTERLKERFEHDGHDARIATFNDTEAVGNEEVLEEIDETYSELVTRQNHELHHAGLHATDDASSSAEIKPAKHEEIKAIFNDAFKQINTVSVASTAPDSVAKQVSAEASSELGAQIKPVTVAAPKAAAANDVAKSSLPAMLQSQMDLIAVIYLANETSIANIKASIGGFFEDYDKPIYLHALINETDWVQLTTLELQPDVADLNTTKITCSLQLADRAGAVTRSILNRFQLAVETLGLDIDGHVEWQSNGDSLLAASALDAFCIEVDKTMGFHLVHGEHGAFTGTKLRGLGEAQGLVLEADGAFKFYNDSDSAINNSPSVSFVMFNRDNYPFSPEMLRNSVVKGVTFQLDIPHVAQCIEAFNHMVQVARQMELGLHAVLVDDNNRPLGDMQIEKIRQQLKVIYATMLVRGIVPGSDSARRLFS